MKTIEVQFDTWTQTFSDWYDVADFLKQRQLCGVSTTILGWSYVE